MTKFVVLFLGLLIAAPAAAQPASQESVERLLQTLKIESAIAALYPTMERMAAGLAQQGSNAPVTEAQRERATKIAALLREEITWANLKPEYVRLYQEAFTQPEIDGLLVFYESPPGQAYIAKMPMLARKSMEITQRRLQALMPKIRATLTAAEPPEPAAPK